MMTHGDFRWLKYQMDSQLRASSKRKRESEELEAEGNVDAATEKIQEAEALVRKAIVLQREIEKSPGYDQWATLSVAAGVELTGNFVDHKSAAAAVKRGLTLRGLNDRPAAEVAAMVAADAATPDKSVVSGKSPTKKSPRKSKNDPIVKFAQQRLENGKKYAAITAEWNDSHQNDQRSQDAIERAVRRARKADKGGHVI